MGMELEAQEKLELLRAAWVRQIATESSIGRAAAGRIVELAELKGLFDAAKETFAREDD